MKIERKGKGREGNERFLKLPSFVLGITWINGFIYWEPMSLTLEGYEESPFTRIFQEVVLISAAYTIYIRKNVKK